MGGKSLKKPIMRSVCHFFKAFNAVEMNQFKHFYWFGLQFYCPCFEGLMGTGVGGSFLESSAVQLDSDEFLVSIENYCDLK